MKLAVITGASTGIGLRAAQTFTSLGFKVINISRRTTEDIAIQDIQCDLSEANALAVIEPQLIRELKKADSICLVHNACRMLKDSVKACDSEAMRAALEVNVIAPNSLNQLFIPYMKKASSIIYLGSTLSEKAVTGTFSYVTSKHAVIGMMRATCQDLMGTAIHTACICPGFTDTQMLRQHLGGDEKALKQIAQMNSFGRLIKSQEIADLIVWVEANPVVNGSVMHANLGQIES